MNGRTWSSVCGALFVLALATLACGGGALPAAGGQATAVPAQGSGPPTAPAALSGTLDVVSTYGYKDSGGYYHVVGLIRNGTAQPVSSVELTLTLKNAAGKSILRDNNNQPAQSVKFNPELNTLASGEASPFDYSVNTADVGEPAANGYGVTITGQQTAQVTRAKVTAQNVQMLADGSGNLYVTGEIVNQDSQAAEISSYAAAALDDKGNLVAANDAGSLAITLAPAGDNSGNDHTPFSFRLDSPGDAAKTPAIYLDATVTDSYALPKVTVKVTNTYFDVNKDYHLVGTMTNNDSQVLTVRLVAGLFAKDNTPLDADTVDSAFDLASGQSVPFDFRGFQAVGSLPDSAGKVDHYTVQVDPYWTFPATSASVQLQTADDKKTDNGNGAWDYAGSVTNTSGKQLSSVTVVVAVYDTQNKLVAADSEDVSSQKSAIAANETDTYDATLFLDANVDASKFTVKTFAQGVVK